MTINPDDLDGPDAVAHWRQRHDLVKARSNRQFEELEAVRWELEQAKEEIKTLKLERVRLHEQRQSDRARITELDHELTEALAHNVKENPNGD